MKEEEKNFNIKTQNIIKITKKKLPETTEEMTNTKDILEQITEIEGKKDMISEKIIQSEETDKTKEKIKLVFNQIAEKVEKKDFLLEKQIKSEETLKENLEELKKLQENLELKSEKDIYVQEIIQKYGDFESFVSDLTKELPENMCKFTPEEGFSQYLIQQGLEEESNIYNYLNDS